MKKQCPHNEWVVCWYQACDRCGWNPKVSRNSNEKPAPEGGICPNNEMVLCEEKNCETCGWDPQVAETRLRRIKDGFSGDHE